MYRSAFIGTGGRAYSHAHAYKTVKSIRFVAGADINAERVNAFAKEFGLPADCAYTDYRRMLAAQKPDIVHLVTNPDVRAEAVRACAAQGVKAMIIEKPLAVTVAEAEEIEKIARTSGMKIAVNTQRRFFQSWRDLCRLVHSGEAGEILWLRLHSLAAVFCTGSHIVDLVQTLMKDVDPVHVWSGAYGAHEYHSSHPGPSSFLTSITYPRRVHLLWEASQDGPGVIGADNYWMHLEINIRTSRGHIWWTEANGWGYQLQGMSQPRELPTSFVDEDPIAQGAFTEAMATWLNDTKAVHPNALDSAMRVFRILATMVQSAALGRRIEYDPTSLKDHAAALRLKLEAAEGIHPERQKWDWNPPPRSSSFS